MERNWPKNKRKIWAHQSLFDRIRHQTTTNNFKNNEITAEDGTIVKDQNGKRRGKNTADCPDGDLVSDCSCFWWAAAQWTWWWCARDRRGRHFLGRSRGGRTQPPGSLFLFLLARPSRPTDSTLTCCWNVNPSHVVAVVVFQQPDHAEPVKWEEENKDCRPSSSARKFFRLPHTQGGLIASFFFFSFDKCWCH